MSAAQTPGTPTIDEQIAHLPIEERALIRWQLMRAAAARQSDEAFFEYVIREETTQLPVKTLAHQRVFFAFREKHRRCVIRMPVGFGKTFNAASYLMRGAGLDPFMTSAVISSTLEQAQKPVSMIRFYIEESPELRIVFPKLRKTKRDGEKWTQTHLYIDRPGILRDATFTAIGQDSGRLPGSRLKWIAVDDILSRENSQTQAQRKAIIDWFAGEVLSRLLKDDPRCCVTNTPRDPQDLTYFLEKERGWPTMTMDAFGDLQFSNTDFDCDDIRPTYRVQAPTVDDPCRLAAHDAEPYVAKANAEAFTELPADAHPTIDTLEVVPLWPERWGLTELNTERAEAVNLREWNQTMRCKATSDDSARVKREWVERCRAVAIEVGHPTLVKEWSRGRAYTGVDLAVGKGKQHDKTCLYTIHVNDAGIRIPLDVETGRFTGKQILEKIADKHARFGSIIRVETNAAQAWMKEFALEVDPGIPIRSHVTGKNKTDVNFGVESVFADIENGLWAIPSGSRDLEEWVEGLFAFDPDKHTPDDLMASWFAREAARQAGAFAAARAKKRGGKGIGAALGSTLRR